MILWKEVCNRLARGETIAAATIATSDGSTPRSAGAKMLVGKTGILAGTVGGGPAEARAAEEAVKTIADGENRMFSVDMTGSAAEGADLICGGVVRIFVQALRPEYLDVAQTVYDRMRRGQDTFLVTRMEGGFGPVAVFSDSEDAVLSGTGLAGLGLSASEWAAMAEEVRECSGGAALLRHGDGSFLVEAFRARTRLVLAGGGHVSRATARVAVMVGFDVTVLDDREEFASPARFSDLPPERVITVPEFHDCLAESVLGYPVGRNCCIAILTRGHMYDHDVLAQALRTPAGYIGMIGSRRKRDALYDRLVADGVDRTELERVHCPIGLPLGGDTPEEIAVSIAAELIAARSKGL